MLGMIGFIRILQHSGEVCLTIKDNYIEVDTAHLKKFHQYYFQYFFDQYNMAERIEERVTQSFEKIKFYLEDESGKKEIKDKLKTEKKNIISFLKSQSDKVKKIDEVIYEEMINICNEIENMREKEDIEKLDKLQKKILENFYQDNINKKITLDKFRSELLYNKFFGQVSFLQKKRTNWSFEKQQELMYKDYVSNIVETGNLQNILKERYDWQDLQRLVEEKKENQLLTKDFHKIYNHMDKKFIQKKKEIEEVKEYIQNTVFEGCSMCGNLECITSDYTEGSFLPLAMSSDNARNFFWNQNVRFPICDVCKLILFCIPAGVTMATKIVKEYSQKKRKMVYTEKNILSFINYESNVETLLKTNNYFANQSKKDKMQYNPYGELILSIVEQERKVSEWSLQNIFVVEFEAEYGKFSRIQYFNIKRYVAKFFKNYSYLLNQIKDYKYKLQIVDNILKNKDFTKVINQRLREEIEKENKDGYNSYLATQAQYTLEILKKEEKDVEEEIKKANAKVHVMFALGNQIHDELKKENNENKLDGYIYRMLNCIKTNNKNGFVDIAIRIIWSAGKDIPEILVKNNENLSWQDLGHSFIAGLTSPKYVKNEEEKDGE